MNKEEFSKELEFLCKYYDDTEMNKTKIVVWFNLSEKYTVKEFHNALMEHIQTDEYPTFPSFGKLYKHLINIKRYPTSDTKKEIKALDTWFEEQKLKYVVKEQNEPICHEGFPESLK